LSEEEAYQKNQEPIDWDKFFRYFVEHLGQPASEFEKLTIPKFLVLICDPKELNKEPPAITPEQALRHIRQYQKERLEAEQKAK
jgi:hypothetical protein